MLAAAELTDGMKECDLTPLKLLQPKVEEEEEEEEEEPIEDVADNEIDADLIRKNDKREEFSPPEKGIEIEGVKEDETENESVVPVNPVDPWLQIFQSFLLSTVKKSGPDEEEEKISARHVESEKTIPIAAAVGGPYQPNYGNQFNIGQLTFNVESPPPPANPPPPPRSNSFLGRNPQSYALLLPAERSEKEHERKSLEKLISFFTGAQLSSEDRSSGNREQLRYKNSPILLQLAAEG